MDPRVVATAPGRAMRITPPVFRSRLCTRRSYTWIDGVLAGCRADPVATGEMEIDSAATRQARRTRPTTIG
jgi:hypothetical protein